MSSQYYNFFNSVRTGKVSELIAQQIKNAILTEVLKPGERLPSERELGERFEASRNSVREALKILEVTGLLVIKRGSGVFVSDVNSISANESLSTLFKMGKVTIYELTQARIILEPPIARLACENITEDDFTQLDENIKETTDAVNTGKEALASNMRFHVLVAEATHNAAITLTMNSLFDVVSATSIQIVRNSPQAFAGSGKALKFHKKILKSFREKDSQKAYGIMLEHILEIQEALIKR